jgi:preprotein translocase subunit SecA
MQKAGMEEDEQIESTTVSKLIEHSQEKVEKHNFEIRKHLIEYDDVLNQHRKVIYNLRQNILKDAEGLSGVIYDFTFDIVSDLVAVYCQDRSITKLQAEKIIEAVAMDIDVVKDKLELEKYSLLNADEFEKDLVNDLFDLHQEISNKIDPEFIKSATKWIMLETIDQAWKQHMINIDHLKEGIGLRGWGQKNPLIEYKREAFGMFEDMMKQIKIDIVRHMFHIKPEAFDQSKLIERRERELNDMKMTSADNSKSETTTTVQRDEDKVGRNEPCACGSGKKFKKCCR